MCLRKNNGKQNLRDNYGIVSGRDAYVFGDGSKQVNIYNTIYNIKDETKEKNYSEEYTKYIKSFKEIENYLYNFIFHKENEIYEVKENYIVFSKKILDWIMGESDFPIDIYKTFCEELINTYNIDKDDVLVKRWEALGYYFSSNIGECVNIYSLFLKNIKELKCSGEIIDDILIDGRNVLFEQKNLENLILFENPFQIEINNHGRKLTMSIYDRIKNDIYEKTLKDTFNMETKDENTVIYGNGLCSNLNEIQNLIFITLFYGSITHLKLCREVISYVMYSYSKIYDNEDFYRISLKMLALSNDYKDYKSLCNHLKNRYKFWYSSEFINNISKLINKTLDYKKINYQNFIYGFYGKYMDDSEYLELENNVFEYLKNHKSINYSIANEIYNSIRINLYRIRNIGELLSIIKIYVDNNYSRYFHEFARILNNVNINSMSKSEYKKYVNIVYKISESDNNINLNLSISKIIFDNKYKRKFNKYKDNAQIKKIIDFDNNISNNCIFIKEMLEDFKKQYIAKENNPKVVISPNIEYTISRSFFLELLKFEQAKEIIEKEYLPLISKILESEYQTNNFKVIQLKNLLYIVSIKEYTYLNNEILKILSKLKYGFGQESQFINCFIHKKIENIEVDLYKKIIKYYLNNNIKIYDLITLCFESVYNDKITLTSIIDCINVVGETQKHDICVINQIYNLYISVSNNSKLFNQNCIKLLRIFANTNYESKAIEIMEKISNDCTLEIAMEIRNVILQYEDIKVRKIINNLRNNSNLLVRLIINK